MEAVSQKSVHGGGLLKEEIKRNIDQSSSGDDDDGCSEDIVPPKGPILPKMEISPSYQKNQEARLKSAKAEMGEVMEENQRLKMYLDKMMKDYRALQMQFRDTIVQQEMNNKPSSGNSVITTTTTHNHHQDEIDQESDDQFVSLSLGRTTTSSSTDHHHHHHPDVKKDDQLTLGLDCKLEVLPSNEQHVSPNPSPEVSLEEVKEDTNAGDQKGTKTMRTDDEVSQQNPAKRARVSVRVRCDTPTMNDGCQWRKYGQKIAKGNPCPRAYYRCTVAPNCPVRKQVQRCAEDMSILITTYEGTHNHQLPISATAMASTTSAAACMLMSGSSTSGSALTQSSTPHNSNINGLNFYLSDNKPKPFYNPIPNSSISSSSSSSSTSFPTITLDLTTNSSSSLASSHLTKLGNNFPPRYSTTTNLNFSSLDSNSLPISWSNGVLSYGNHQYHQSHNKNLNIGSLSFGRQPNQENLPFHQSYLQKSNILNSSNQLQPETLAAITSDPNFQSALAAALTTIIGNSSSEKLSESFPVLSSFPNTSASSAHNNNNSNANKCAPSFLNYKPPSNSSSTTNSQPAGSLMFTSSSSSLPFSTSNTKSTSPAGDHNRDHIS